jgi:uncharacterized protein DUF5335
MSVTTKVPHERLAEYFATFTRRFLMDDSPEAVDVEVLEPDLGEQVAAQGVRLVGVTFDPKGNTLEIELDFGDHRVYDPKEVWTIEESDGFLSAIEVVHRDGEREVISVRRMGLRHP